jgi:predicted permease
VDREPWTVRWLVRWAAPAHREELLGDLTELWHASLATRRGGRWRWGRHALSAIWWSRRQRAIGAAPDGDPPPRGRWGRQLMQDTRYFLRMAVRQPAFTLLTIGTLGLGIAAATAVFTICSRVLIQPLPYTDPDRIVVLDNVGFGFTARGMTVARFVADLPELAAVGLYAPGGLNLGDADMPLRVPAAAVSHGFFPALGAAAALGRTTSIDDDLAFAPVAVISAGAWRRLFDADPAAPGRQLRLNSQAFTVIGVMPDGFSFPAGTDVWIPVGADQQLTGAAFAPMLVARLRHGVSEAQTVEALARAEAAQGRSSPDDDRPIVTPLKTELVGGTRPSLLFLTGLAGLLLAATSANVAGLLLARLRTRQRELLLRSALGASRGRLVRQVATECALLSAAGAAAGFGLAILIVRAFRASVPTFAPHVDLTRIDADMLAVGGGVTLAVALLFGAGPAAAVLRRPPAGVMREGASPSRGARWFGQTLVVVQIAAALVLLAGTGAALTAMVRLHRVPLGFDNARAIVFELTLPFSRYRNAAAVTALVEQIETALRRLPGVRAVGVTDYAPGSAQTGIGMRLLETHEPRDAEESRPGASMLMATPGYFDAMGVRVIAGRRFTSADRAAAPRVAIVSEGAARSLTPDPAGAVGRRVQMRFGKPGESLEIVGVVADVRLRRQMTGTQTQIYLPVAQSFVRGSAGVVIDADGSEEQVIARARQVLTTIDPELPLYNVVRVADLRARFLATERVTLALGGAFGALALALAAIGLYGTLSQLVAQRRREIGIRLALGASRARLTGSVVWTSVRVAGLGCAAGVALTAGGAQMLAAAVPSFEAPGAGVMALDVLVLLAAAIAAAWLPARRAARVDPLVALRAE